MGSAHLKYMIFPMELHLSVFQSMAGQCGVPAVQGGSRIVGGYEAVPHSFPWMAALFVDEQWFCGGTLISDE